MDNVDDVALAGAVAGERELVAAYVEALPVVATILGVTIEAPSVWAALILVLLVVALPMYLVARRASD